MDIIEAKKKALSYLFLHGRCGDSVLHVTDLPTGAYRTVDVPMIFFQVLPAELNRIGSMEYIGVSLSTGSVVSLGFAGE